MTFKLCSVIEYEIKNIYMEKSHRKCAPKATPRSLFILVNNSKQPLHAGNYFKNKIF